MTSQERDYDDILRRALRAAGESVEPAADGLERIRGRVSTRHASPFMLLSEFVEYWFRQLPLWLESGTRAARSALSRLGAGPRAAAHRTQPAPTGWRARLRPAFTRLGPAASWLKPVLAVGGAVGVLGGVTVGSVEEPELDDVGSGPSCIGEVLFAAAVTSAARTSWRRASRRAMRRGWRFAAIHSRSLWRVHFQP